MKTQEQNLLSLAVNMLNNSGLQGWRLKEYIESLEKENLELKSNEQYDKVEGVVSTSIDIDSLKETIKEEIINELKHSMSVHLDTDYRGETLEVALYYDVERVTEDHVYLSSLQKD